MNALSFTIPAMIMIMIQGCNDPEPMEIPISMDIPGRFTYVAGRQIHVLEKDKFLSTDNCESKPNRLKEKPQWLLSGSKILYLSFGACPHDGVHILDPTDGENTYVLKGGSQGLLYHAVTNITGERIAVIGQHMLAIYAYDGLTLQKTDSIATYFSHRISLSPDSKTVILHHGATIYIYQVGGDTIVEAAGAYIVGNISWSNQSDQFAFDALSDIHVSTRDVTAIQNLTNTGDIYETGPAWSPVAAEIVFVRSFLFEQQDELVLYDLAKNTEEVIFQHEDFTDISDLQWSQDGRKIAFYNSNSDINGGIYVIDRSGAELTRYTDNGQDFDWIYP